jgi:hypothetical protein
MRTEQASWLPPQRRAIGFCIREKSRFLVERIPLITMIIVDIDRAAASWGCQTGRGIGSFARWPFAECSGGHHQTKGKRVMGGVMGVPVIIIPEANRDGAGSWPMPSYLASSNPVEFFHIPSGPATGHADAFLSICRYAPDLFVLPTASSCFCGSERAYRRFLVM